MTVGRTVDEAAILYSFLENACHSQLLAEAAAANGVPKRIIGHQAAQYTADVAQNPVSFTSRLLMPQGLSFAAQPVYRIPARVRIDSRREQWKGSAVKDIKSNTSTMEFTVLRSKIHVVIDAQFVAVDLFGVAWKHCRASVPFRNCWSQMLNSQKMIQTHA